jgi:hypothetical protein
MKVVDARRCIRKAKSITAFVLVGQDAGVHVKISKPDAERALDALLIETGDTEASVRAHWNAETREFHFGD